MNNCLGIINLDENVRDMGELVKKRNLAAVPIAARYRVIDFILSNMKNSDVESIGIFVETKARALVDHLKNGRPWDLHRKNGLKVFNFSDEDLTFDDVHSFAEDMEYIKNSKKEYVLLAPSYMICNIDYEKIIDEHKDSGRDVTIVYKHLKESKSSFDDCNVLNIDEGGRVISIGENIENSENINI